jgi:hopanoid-associated phosphorylase
MHASPSVLAVTCLAFEARIAAGRGVRVFCAGDRSRLPGRLDRAAAGDCLGIVSFGVAGGLDPALAPGDLVVASSVVAEDRRFVADDGWARALVAMLPGAVHASISGVEAPVADPAAKRSLRQLHRTAAVDTESHLAARVAARHRLPFAAVRVILDPATRRLPPAALLPLRPDGTADVRAVLRSVWREPAQVVDLLKIVTDASLAWSILARGRRLLGDGLGFPHVAVERGDVLASDESRLVAQPAAGSS